MIYLVMFFIGVFLVLLPFTLYYWWGAVCSKDIKRIILMSVAVLINVIPLVAGGFIMWAVIFYGVVTV